MECRSSDSFLRGSTSYWAWHWAREEEERDLIYLFSYSEVLTPYRIFRASSDTASPNMPPLPPLQQIINDTSLAATVLANDDRHLFFQDPQGVIRRVSRAASAIQWILDSVPIPIMDPRNFTPIAVTSRKFPYNAQEVL